MQPWITYFTNHPRKLFLTDGLGAGVSTLAYLVLSRFPTFTGLPETILVSLGLLAATYATISLGAAGGNTRRPAPILRLVATANTLHCALVIGLLIAHREILTGWGLAYFIGEMAIVGVLVFLEVRVARNLST